jgi:alcohol dehydrogenase (cytochrome c)
VWDTQVADPQLGYEYTSGPIVVRGKVIAGITGCSRYKDDVCFITAHDAATGKELWRTSTIARPGEPGGDTWGDLPLTFRAGGDAWISGSYDPETNLIYWGTAQAKPWARVARGTDGDALYTNSTLALDPDSGKMKWYYQHMQGFPITYLAKGKQYVAMPAGIGGGSWSTLITPELAPEIRQPNPGNALLVFALPGK